VWAAWQRRGVAADVNEALAVGANPEFPDLVVELHAFSFANGLYRAGTNTFVPHKYPGPVPDAGFDPDYVEINDEYGPLAAPMYPGPSAEIIPLYAGSDPNLDAAAVYFEAELPPEHVAVADPLAIGTPVFDGLVDVGACGVLGRVLRDGSWPEGLMLAGPGADAVARVLRDLVPDAVLLLSPPDAFALASLRRRRLIVAYGRGALDNADAAMAVLEAGGRVVAVVDEPPERWPGRWTLVPCPGVPPPGYAATLRAELPSIVVKLARC
jgi:hypothetical protein